ncbi:hypothetical protein HKD37_15G042784 [Glycine soja]
MSEVQGWVMVRWMDSLRLNPYTMQMINVINVNITLKHGLTNHNERDNIVAWFYLLRKKPDIHIKATINNAMKTLKASSAGKFDQPAPHWIEVKSHTQIRGYKCDYYAMHWMWNIVSGGLKNEWSMEIYFHKFEFGLVMEYR